MHRSLGVVVLVEYRPNDPHSRLERGVGVELSRFGTLEKLPKVVDVLAVGQLELEIVTLDGVGEVAGRVQVSRVRVWYAVDVVTLVAIAPTPIVLIDTYF